MQEQQRVVRQKRGQREVRVGAADRQQQARQDAAHALDHALQRRLRAILVRRELNVVAVVQLLDGVQRLAHVLPTHAVAAEVERLGPAKQHAHAFGEQQAELEALVQLGQIHVLRLLQLREAEVESLAPDGDQDRHELRREFGRRLTLRRQAVRVVLFERAPVVGPLLARQLGDALRDLLDDLLGALRHVRGEQQLLTMLLLLCVARVQEVVHRVVLELRQRNLT